jgi:hypothetical protein
LAEAVAASTAAVEVASTVAALAVAASAAAAEAASTVAGLVAATSAAAVLAEAVSVQSEAEVSAQPLSEAEASAQPLLGAVDFAVEPSEPMVSAAGGSTTTGADLRSVHLRSG